MRGALGLLCQLKNEFDLDYVLAVRTLEATSDKEKVLHTERSVSSCRVAQEVLSAMKEPLKKVNASL